MSLDARITGAIEFYEIALDRGWSDDQVRPLADEVRRLLAERAAGAPARREVVAAG